MVTNKTQAELAKDCCSSIWFLAHVVKDRIDRLNPETVDQLLKDLRDIDRELSVLEYDTDEEIKAQAKAKAEAEAIEESE